jgi:hypothetical protein
MEDLIGVDSATGLDPVEHETRALYKKAEIRWRVAAERLRQRLVPVDLPGVEHPAPDGVEAVAASGVTDLHRCPSVPGPVPRGVDLDQGGTVGNQPSGDPVEKPALVVVGADTEPVPVGDDVEDAIEFYVVEVSVDHRERALAGHAGKRLDLLGEDLDHFDSDDIVAPVRHGGGGLARACS